MKSHRLGFLVKIGFWSKFQISREFVSTLEFQTDRCSRFRALPRHCFQSAHQSLLERLEDLRQLIQTQPNSFPHSASVNGLDRRSKSHDTQQGATEQMNLSLECLCMIKGSDPKHLRTNTFSKNMKIWGWTLLPFQIWQCTRMKEIMSRVFSRIRDERWLPCVSKMTRTRTTVIVQLNMILTTKMNSHQNEFTCTYDYICVSISVEQSCGHQKALRATSRCSFKWRKQLLRIFGPELIWVFYSINPLRWGWVYFERTRILSGIQFTRDFIKFVVAETKQFVSSNVNVILTWQNCGQHSCMSAGSKHRALTFYFGVRICHQFQISKCTGESDSSLCTTSVLAIRMPPRIVKFWQTLQPTHFLIGSRHPAAAFVMQVPKSCTDLDPNLLYILTLGTYSEFVWKNKM